MLIDFHPTTIVTAAREPHDVYVGSGSKWQNPYIVGNHGTIEQVRQKYANHLVNSPALTQALPELWGKRLGYEGYLRECHAPVLKHYSDLHRKALWEATRAAPIKGFTDQYRFMSNFYPAQVIINGQAYRTSEHAYQAAKTLDPTWRQKIAECPTPGQAKRMGNKAPLREDWQNIRIEIMRLVVQEKFRAYPPLQKALLSTGKAPLEETNHWNDRFWGTCKGTGKNHLGKLLMELRTSLHKREVKLIIAGSRTCTNYPLLKQSFEEFLKDYSNHQVKIISGMAAGVDSMGIELAKEYCLPVTEMPAKWDLYGNSAGYKRNAQMAKKATHLLALWDGESKGTSHMINLAAAENLVSKTVTYAQ